MVVSRGSSNGNQRGNSYQRARRRQFLVDKFGDGVKVKCVHCGMMLTVETVTSDRIIPGALGGTYRRDNIQPSCARDNSSLGGKLGAQLKRSRNLKKGDEVCWMGCLLKVTAVAKDGSWANFKVTEIATGATWTKRMKLPLPVEAVS